MHVLDGAADIVHVSDVDVDCFYDVCRLAEVDDVVDVELVFGDDEEVVEYVVHDVLCVEVEAGTECGGDECEGAGCVGVDCGDDEHD